MPHARAMPSIGRACHELRVRDRGQNWQIFLRVDENAVVILGVLAKKTRSTPKKKIELCRERLRLYDRVARGENRR
jgi:phage-related protein